MISLRGASIATSAEYLDWVPEEKKAVLYYPDRVVTMWIGNKKYIIERR